MKNLICLFLAFCWVISAKADPCRYEWRSWGGVSIKLEPLFNWWAFTSKATNATVYLDTVNVYTMATVSNLWVHLPPKPGPEWCRIQGQILQTGKYWKVNASIQPAPMMVRHAVIYLSHPPAGEVQYFTQAKADLASLQSANGVDMNIASNAEQHRQAAEDYADSWSYAAQAFPYNDRINNEMSAAHSDAGRAINTMNSANDRMNSRQARIQYLQEFLKSFPDQSTYVLDHFARPTGQQIDGFDVYDLGNAQGLTY